MRDAWLDRYVTEVLDAQVHRNGIRILPRLFRRRR